MRDDRRVPLARPFTAEEEVEEVRRVLESGQLSQGPKVAEFEAAVAEYVGVRHAFATSSCTTALHLSLAALGIGAGDDVLVPDFTFPATANVVVQLGAVPVLVDIDLQTYNVDPGDLERRATARTRAAMPVHLFGLSADMDPVLAFAGRRDWPVVEDAACALGTTYNGRPCGAMGAVGCLSFHARKVITTGEGGMVLTDSDDLAETLSLLRNHGGARHDGRFVFDDAGFNYRLSDVQAALGLAQMRRLPWILARRRELAAAMTERLSGTPGVSVPLEPRWGGHVYQSFVVLLDDDVNRDAVISAMRELGVETTLGTYALHAQPFFRRRYGYTPGDLVNSHAAYRRSLALPLYPQMAEEDVDAVCAALRSVLARRR